jgi:hypothetical protein
MTTPRQEDHAAAPSAAPAPELGSIPRHWSPSEQVPPVSGHAGQPLPLECVFVVAPPEEIGAVRTAHSTIRTHTPIFQKVWPRIKGIVFGALCGLVLSNIVCILLIDTHDPAYVKAVGIAALVGAVIGLFAAGPKALCTFVGERGVASFLLDGRTFAVKKQDVFLFPNAADLRVSMTRNYTNGIYTGTNYGHIWNDAHGKQVFLLKGDFYHAKGKPPADSPYYFALSSEAAWTDYMLAVCTARLAHGESVRFPLKGANYVEVGPQVLELRVGNKSDRMGRDEVGSITVDQGQVMVARTDAKAGFLGVGSSGVFKFPYAELANARLFFALLGHAFADEQVAGGLNPAPAFAIAQTVAHANRQANAIKQGAAAPRRPPRFRRGRNQRTPPENSFSRRRQAGSPGRR